MLVSKRVLNSVLIASEHFNKDGESYAQTCGLGKCANTAPPNDTCFFSGNIIAGRHQKDEVKVHFDFDKCKCNVKTADIHRRARDTEGSKVWWVVTEEHPDKWTRVTGVHYEKGGEVEPEPATAALE